MVTSWNTKASVVVVTAAADGAKTCFIVFFSVASTMRPFLDTYPASHLDLV